MDVAIAIAMVGHARGFQEECAMRVFIQRRTAANELARVLFEVLLVLARETL